MAVSRPRPPYSLFAVFFLLAVTLLAVVYRYGIGEEAAVEQQVRGHLLNMADLKVEMLSSWRKHRLGEIQSIVNAPGMLEIFERLSEGRGSSGERARLEAWFAQICRDLPYANMMLVDPHGNLAASVGPRYGNTEHFAWLGLYATRLPQPDLLGFHADEGGAVHLGLLAPLRRYPGAPAFGALLAAVDPATQIYPVLQTWLGPGATGETMLLGREGSDSISLNPLRFAPDSTLRMRVPLTRTERVGVQAVLGATGNITGTDYRGVAVFAAARKVPGTDWTLLVKTDRSEALALLVRGWIFLGCLAVGLILAAAAGVIWLWRRQELHFFLARMQAEENLRLVLETSPAAIMAWDVKTRTLIWNGGAEDLFGWKAEEVIGRPLPTVPPEYHWHFYEVHKQLEDGEVVRGIPVAALRKDGSRVSVNLSCALMRDLAGKVVGDVAVMYDITAQKRTEEALQASEALLRAAFNQAAVGMAHVRLDGRFMRVNRRYCLITGYAEAELFERSYEDITCRADLTTEQEQIGRLASGLAEEHARELRYMRKGGLEVWVRRTASVVRSRTGEPLHLMMVIEDITEQVKAREELERSEARLRQVVENAPEGIAVVNDLTYRYVNPALAHLLEDESNALVGRSVLDRLQAADRDHVREQRRQFEIDHSVPASVLHTTTLKGRPLVVEVSSASIEWDGETAALVFFRDITARKRHEEERSRLELQLQHSQKMESIGRLAGGVSHDFNNLLTIINGYTEMLLGQTDIPASTRESLEEVRAAGARAAALTQQLLAFSRKQIAEPKVLNLNCVIRDSERMLRRLIGENIEIVTELAPDLNTVLADRGQMDQVLMNLVVNARDAMPSGGRIRIQTRNAALDASEVSLHAGAVPGTYAVLSVSDNGTGMNDDTLRHVFEPFFTTKPRSAGTGLGLSTVYGIVNHAGGWIDVASQVDHGSTFQIWLPRNIAALEEPSVNGGSRFAAAARRAPESETVMVVEDEVQVRRIVLAILRQNGYHLIEAADGTEALTLCERRQGPIHLLITDVMMPGINGVELSRRMQRLRPQLKTLYISGYTADVLAPSGVLQGGQSYLAKPFTPAELSRKVRGVLGERVSGRILVVDDDPAVCSLIERLLTDSGYDVSVASNGDAGLRIVREQSVDIVITDLVMPEREGLETIPMLRSLRPEASIVAISGAFGGQYLKAARLLGADWTLPKPVDREELLTVVRDLLSRKKSPAPAA